MANQDPENHDSVVWALFKFPEGVFMCISWEGSLFVIILISDFQQVLDEVGPGWLWCHLNYNIPESLSIQKPVDRMKISP